MAGLWPVAVSIFPGEGKGATGFYPFPFQLKNGRTTRMPKHTRRQRRAKTKTLRHRRRFHGGAKWANLSADEKKSRRNAAADKYMDRLLESSVNPYKYLSTRNPDPELVRSTAETVALQGAISGINENVAAAAANVRAAIAERVAAANANTSGNASVNAMNYNTAYAKREEKRAEAEYNAELTALSKHLARPKFMSNRIASKKAANAKRYKGELTHQQHKERVRREQHFQKFGFYPGY